jgi:uncharacterized protein
MIILLSPAKTLDFKKHTISVATTAPIFQQQANEIAAQLKSYDIAELRKLLGISESLARLTFERYQSWVNKPGIVLSKQAIHAFKGDVYQGLRADDFSEDDLLLAQDKVRILSGLYGILRPLDQMQPHRLEMGTQLAVAEYPNLYHLWNDKIANQLRVELHEKGDLTLLNLASKEYSDAVDFGALGVRVVQPVFMDYSSGKYRVISFFAKKARGLMTRYIIKNRIGKVDDIKSFNLDNYFFNPPMSRENQWFFTRG